MRNIALLSLIGLSACSTMAATEPEPPVRGETPGYTCREDGLGRFVGRAASADVGAEILRQSGARTLRWIPHDGVITMDLRYDRVNVRLDPQNRITSVSCG